MMGGLEEESREEGGERERETKEKKKKEKKKNTSILFNPRQDGNEVGDPVSTGHLNGAKYLREHSEHQAREKIACLLNVIIETNLQSLRRDSEKSSSFPSFPTNSQTSVQNVLHPPFQGTDILYCPLPVTGNPLSHPTSGQL